MFHSDGACPGKLQLSHHLSDPPRDPGPSQGVMTSLVLKSAPKCIAGGGLWLTTILTSARLNLD